MKGEYVLQHTLTLVEGGGPVKGSLVEYINSINADAQLLDAEPHQVVVFIGRSLVQPATNKTKKPITIEREFIPRFNLEKYTKKLNIRKIDDDNRLLEFYVSVYPDSYDRSSRLFLSEVKKIIINPDLSNTFEMKSVDFISYKTLGANDFLEYKYSDVTYDKIVEFNGFYVIKFKCKVVVNGRDIFEEHRQEVLDKKYENKDKK